MKIFQIVSSAQKGRTFQNMGEAFGLSDETVAQSVRYFIPAVVKAVERQADTPDGLLAILEFLGSRRYDRFLDDPRIFSHAYVKEEGERALTMLFRSETRIKKVVENRAQRLPILAEDLRHLFPIIAVMTLGAIEIRTRKPIGVILHRLTEGELEPRAVANPYLALAQYLKKQAHDEKLNRRSRLFQFLGTRAAERPKIGPRAERKIGRNSLAAQSA